MCMSNLTEKLSWTIQVKVHFNWKFQSRLKIFLEISIICIYNKHVYMSTKCTQLEDWDHQTLL